eukprot:scaffold20799_cov73-Cylindrotheca_fusiformis.AAC.1
MREVRGVGTSPPVLRARVLGVTGRIQRQVIAIYLRWDQIKQGGSEYHLKLRASWYILAVVGGSGFQLCIWLHQSSLVVVGQHTRDQKPMSNSLDFSRLVSREYRPAGVAQLKPSDKHNLRKKSSHKKSVEFQHDVVGGGGGNDDDDDDSNNNKNNKNINKGTKPLASSASSSSSTTPAD